MELKGNKQGEFFVVSIGGRMDAISAPDFEKFCLELIGQGESKLIGDLKDLLYISSAGLRSILIVGNKLKSINGSLSFASLSPGVAHVFSISDFTSMFPVHDSLEQAIGGS